MPLMVIMRHDFRLLDLVTLSLAYTFAVIPALILAWVDQAFHRLEGTTIAAAAIAYLAARSIGFPFLDYRATLMIGLIGAIPAAVCSWLSSLSSRVVICTGKRGGKRMPPRALLSLLRRLHAPRSRVSRRVRIEEGDVASDVVFSPHALYQHRTPLLQLSRFHVPTPWSARE